MLLQLPAASWGLTPWLQKSVGVLGLGPEPFAVTLALGDLKLSGGVGGQSLAGPDSCKCLLLLCAPWQVFQMEISNRSA